MQPLGSPALLAAYNARVSESHDYTLAVDVIDMEEKVLAPALLIDGQINILRDADVRRTATLTLLDPDHSLGLDSGSVYNGALFADRMVRIRHSIDVPGFGTVTCTPFVGPITRLNRNGATIDIECQDKTGLSILGGRPMTVTKNTNAVAAIRSMLSDRSGETRFRFPSGTRFRLSRNYSSGWSDEASVWAVCSRMAWAQGLRLLYSCDGHATLRPRQTAEVFTLSSETNVTSAVAGDYDFSSVVNYARATAGDKLVRTAIAPSSHPLSPTSLGRNGVGRYLPALGDVDAPPERPKKPGTKRRPASKAQLNKFAVEMEKYVTQKKSTSAKAQAMADSLLAAGLPQSAALSFSALPVFHLDVDDIIRVTGPDGTALLPFAEASIPLVSGDMTVGLLRRGRPTRIRR